MSIKCLYLHIFVVWRARAPACPPYVHGAWPRSRNTHRACIEMDTDNNDMNPRPRPKTEQNIRIFRLCLPLRHGKGGERGKTWERRREEQTTFPFFSYFSSIFPVPTLYRSLFSCCSLLRARLGINIFTGALLYFCVAGVCVCALRAHKVAIFFFISFSPCAHSPPRSS